MIIDNVSLEKSNIERTFKFVTFQNFNKKLSPKKGACAIKEVINNHPDEDEDHVKELSRAGTKFAVSLPMIQR